MSKSATQREEAARLEAERALTPRATLVQREPEPATTEPTLEQRLADIDRRARQRAEDEKRSLAGQYLSERRRELRRLMEATADDALRSVWNEVQRLERLVDGGSGPAVASNGGSSPAPVARRSSGEGTNRDYIVDIVREAGKIRPSEILAQAVTDGKSKASINSALMQLRKEGVLTQIPEEGRQRDLRLTTVL